MGKITIGVKVRITGPAYHNAIGTIVPRTDRILRDLPLCRVRLDEYLDTGSLYVLVRECEVIQLAPQGGA